MKKLLFFMVAGLLWQCTCAQPFIRHYWLDDFGKNYTLNRRVPGQHDPNHGYVLAASSQDAQPSKDGYTDKRAIVIMKLHLDYSIEDSRVFKFDETSLYNFEIHDIYPWGGYYYLCGDMSTPDGNSSAIVGIVDTNLNNMQIHAYNEIKSFASIYAEGGCYYVCGEDKFGNGIILENDYSHTINRGYSIKYKPLYKIKAKNGGGELKVVGTDGNEIVYFYIQTNSALPGFSQPNVYKFQAPSPENVSITNYPGNQAGMIISTAVGDSVYFFFFDNLSTYSHGYAFGEPYGYPVFVRDINCASNKLALVGEYDDNGFGSACFFKCNLAQGGVISAPYYAQFPPQFAPNTPEPIVFKLYKVFHDITDTLFHAGGYCDYRNNSTTFVGTPEEIWTNNDGTCANPFLIEVNPTRSITIQLDSCDEFPIIVDEHFLKGRNKEYQEHTKCEQEIINK
jgi:hypothetical protein